MVIGGLCILTSLRLLTLSNISLCEESYERLAVRKFIHHSLTLRGNHEKRCSCKRNTKFIYVTRSTGQGDISQPLIEGAFQQHSTLPSGTVFQQGGIILYNFSFRKKGQMSSIMDYLYNNHADVIMFRRRQYYIFACSATKILLFLFFINIDDRFWCILQLRYFHYNYVFVVQISVQEYSKSMCTLSFTSYPPVPQNIYTQLQDEFHGLIFINYFIISTLT